MNFLQRLFWGVVGGSIALSCYAATFVVDSIIIQGNKRLSAEAIRHLLGHTISVGAKLDVSQGQRVIKKLFATGDFSQIQLLRQGNALIIQVQETPILGRVTLTGNKEIESKKLEPFLKQLAIIRGNRYNPSQVNQFRQSLLATYKSLGYTQVQITPVVQKSNYNTVFLEIQVKEGKPTKVAGIRFVGNHVFSAATLRKQLSLTTSGLFTFLTHSDRYSSMRLEKDLGALREFYHNQGYLDFQVLHQEVDFKPSGQKGAVITVSLSEGNRYVLKSTQVQGAFSQERTIVKKVRELRPGAFFSTARVLAVKEDIQAYLGNLGYASAQVAWQTILDHKTHTVQLILRITTGPKVYVRYIHILGNNYTSEETVRKRLRQLEGSLYSREKIQESSRRIANLPYFKIVGLTQSGVPGKPNQMDLTYQLEEVNAGVASIQGGYSGTDGFTYGANVSQPNFMGTGRYVSVGFQNSAYAHQYNFSYTNPLYTDWGVSRGIDVYYTHTTPEDVNLDSYTMNSYGFDWRYSFPISDHDQLDLGYGYSHVEIKNVNPEVISPSAYAFLQKYPGPYSTPSLSAGFSHSSLDQAIFPFAGNAQSLLATLAIPVLKKSLAYYKLDYTGRWYWFLPNEKYGINPHLTLGYGQGYGKQNKDFPFFLNYYGGGIDSLPGYEANTLGPSNPNNTENAIGGNLSVFGGLNFVFPNGLSENLRSALFVDFGNVFQTNTSTTMQYEKVRFSNLRWSSGLMVSWRAPFGILSLSYAIPFRTKSGDHLQQFGFSIGSSL